MTKQGISDSDHTALIAGAYKFKKRELGLIDNTEMGVLAMTHDEMAEELRRAGWRVKPPLTQDNCPHHNTGGSCGIGAAGYTSEWWCHDCGKRTSHTSPLHPQPFQFLRN